MAGVCPKSRAAREAGVSTSEHVCVSPRGLCPSSLRGKSSAPSITLRSRQLSSSSRWMGCLDLYGITCLSRGGPGSTSGAGLGFFPISTPGNSLIHGQGGPWPRLTPGLAAGLAGIWIAGCRGLPGTPSGSTPASPCCPAGEDQELSGVAGHVSPGGRVVWAPVLPHLRHHLLLLAFLLFHAGCPVLSCVLGRSSSLVRSQPGLPRECPAQSGHDFWCISSCLPM